MNVNGLKIASTLKVKYLHLICKIAVNNFIYLTRTCKYLELFINLKEYIWLLLTINRNI